MYKFLVVDDEPLTREYMRAILPTFFAVPEQVMLFEAEDGIAASELLAVTSIDIVITDIRMPGMDGMQLAELIHNRYQNTFVMLLSGYEEFSYAHSAIQFGVMDYLLKPIVKEELYDAILRICAVVEKKREEHKSYLSVLSLSQNYNSIIMQNLIYAAAHQENLKLRTYYELAHKINLSLMEGEGVILLLQIDLERMLLSGVPLREASVYQMILAQYTAELLSDADHVTSCAMPDQNGATLVFLDGDNPTELQNSSQALFDSVANYLSNTMDVMIYAAVGTPVNDILQLDVSYLQARSALVKRLKSGVNALYGFSGGTSDDAIMEFTEPLVAYGKRGNQAECYVLLRRLVEHMTELNHSTVIRYAVFLIYRLFEQNREQLADALECSMRFLEDSASTHKNAEWDTDTVCDLLYKLATPFFGGKLEENSNISQIVSMGKRYICAHFSEPLSLSLIAEKVKVSESYFSNIFHKETGETYLHFLTRTRMENAVRLLRDSPEVKIYQISTAVGYVSVKHFNHIFKQWFGVSPNEYQRTMPE